MQQLLLSTLIYAGLCWWVFAPTLRSKAWTDQTGVITGQFLEMAAYADLPSQMLRTWARSVGQSLRLVVLVLRPSLLILLPTLALFVYWHQGWSKRPILAGDEVIISMAAGTRSSPQLALPRELDCIVSGAFNPIDQRYYWLLSPKEPGQFLIRATGSVEGTRLLICTEPGQNTTPASLLDLTSPIQLHSEAATISLGDHEWGWWWRPLLMTCMWLASISLITAMHQKRFRTRGVQR